LFIMTLRMFELLNIVLRPAEAAGNTKKTYLRHPPFSLISEIRVLQYFYRFYLGEDRLYPNTSFYVFQEKFAKKREIEPKTSLSASPSFLPTGENHIKNKVYTVLLAKIKWKTPQVCARIEDKCKKNEKISI
jgi:hypothetical protein